MTRMDIVMKQLEEALSAGLKCFYFYDDGDFAVCREVEKVTGKKPLYDNHGLSPVYIPQKECMEHFLHAEGIPLGQSYYVILV